MDLFLNAQERESLKQACELAEKTTQEALMANQKAKQQQELEKEITKINGSLESPKLVFTIVDLSEDPTSFTPELIDFLRRHTGDNISLIGSSTLSFPPSSKMTFDAKIKWSLASIEVIPANNKFTAIIKVPIE